MALFLLTYSLTAKNNLAVSLAFIWLAFFPEVAHASLWDC